MDELMDSDDETMFAALMEEKPRLPPPTTRSI
jgi:hypothetical protein